jgi:hypothetical protein
MNVQNATFQRGRNVLVSGGSNMVETICRDRVHLEKSNEMRMNFVVQPVVASSGGF